MNENYSTLTDRQERPKFLMKIKIYKKYSSLVFLATFLTIFITTELLSTVFFNKTFCENETSTDKPKSGENEDEYEAYCYLPGTRHIPQENTTKKNKNTQKKEELPATLKNRHIASCNKSSLKNINAKN